jgi:uncharacterized membrane protein
MDNTGFMRRAKSQLSTHWLYAVLATLVFLTIISLSSSTYVLELILYGPLAFGYVLYLMRLSDSKVSDFSLLFVGFNRFVNTLVAGLLYSLAVGIGMVLFIFPGLIMLCGLSMTMYIMIDDPNVSGVDAIQQSWNMMKGYKWQFFCLQLRFIGWGLLSIITFGIGFLWLYPYVTVTNYNFYRQLRYSTY